MGLFFYYYEINSYPYPPLHREYDSYGNQFIYNGRL